MKRKQLSIKKISALPQNPGVYFLKNKNGDVFYIGKTQNLRTRLQSHERDGKILQAKSYKLKAEYIEYVETANEIEALIREAEYIKKYQPVMNVRLRDDKKYFYVGITDGEFPRVFITHQPTAASCGKSLKTTSYKLQANFLGPFTDGGALKITMKYLRKLFPYYSANPKRPYATQKHRALPCSWCHMGLCPGPEPDKTEYRKNIRAVKNVLNGRKNAVAAQLKRDMKKASREHRFEDAAHARDTLEALQNIFSHTGIVQPWTPKDLILAPSEEANMRVNEKLKKLIGSNKQIHTIEGYDISNIQGKEPTASMVRFSNGKPDKSLYRKFNIKSPATPNDYRMIQEVITRRFAHTEWPYPDLLLIDGGRGQLNAALKALRKLNIDISVVALAKREEELYIPGRIKPILLSKVPQEVANLFKHIRDEAHRFAISHHRKLHRKMFKR